MTGCGLSVAAAPSFCIPKTTRWASGSKEATADEENSATVVRMEKGDDRRGGGMSGSQLTMGNFEARLRAASSSPYAVGRSVLRVARVREEQRAMPA